MKISTLTRDIGRNLLSSLSYKHSKEKVIPIKRHKLKTVGLSVLFAVVIAGGFLLFQSGVITRALSANSVTPSSGSVVGGNIITITGSGFEPDTPTMQNFGADKCATMDVYDGSNIGALLTLKDARDDRNYTVGKLADGNCWMLDNLRLGSTTGTVQLTDADSDLNTITSFTIPQLTTSSADYDNPRAYGVVTGDGAGDHNYGYLYNWSTVTAGESRASMPGDGTNSNVAPNSICSSGWKMPTSAEYAILNGSMFNGVPSGADTTTNTAHATHWKYTGAFRGVFSGQWYSGFSVQGTSGRLWSSSAVSGNQYYAHFVDFSSMSVTLTYSMSRNTGYGVRCLAQTATTDTNHYDPKPYVTVDGTSIDPDDIELVSDTELRIKMPAHLSGMVNMVITLGAETRTVQYEYVDPPAPAVPTTPTNPIIPNVPNTGVGM
jgi:uncharacterized protein (TIGR02145 family)